MKRLLPFLLFLLPSLAHADRLGSLTSDAQVLLTTQAVSGSGAATLPLPPGDTNYVQISTSASVQPGAFRISSGTVSTETVSGSFRAVQGLGLFTDHGYAIEAGADVDGVELGSQSTGLIMDSVKSVFFTGVAGGQTLYIDSSKVAVQNVGKFETGVGTVVDIFGTTRLESLTSQNCLGTDGSGNVQAGTCGAGGGGVSGSTIAISMSFDASTPIGSTRCTSMSYPVTISTWTVVSDSGTFTMHITSSTLANYSSGATTSMSGAGNPPSLTSQYRNSSAVSGWASTFLSAGDLVCGVLDSSSGLTWANVVLGAIR